MNIELLECWKDGKIVYVASGIVLIESDEELNRILLHLVNGDTVEYYGSLKELGKWMRNQKKIQ